MSDDIPLIFSDDLLRPDATGRRVVFVSAMSLPHMQQYATAGWQVITAPGFEGAATIDLGAVPATAGTEADLQGADLISWEAPTWPSDASRRLTGWQPRIVKINGAFHGTTDAQGEAMAATLTALGYHLIGCHWRNDNSYAMRSLTRIEPLAGFGAPDWKHMNLIGTHDAALARTLLTVGRLYVGEERRIAELKVSHAVRGDHITRLEDALMAHQRPRP